MSEFWDDMRECTCEHPLIRCDDRGCRCETCGGLQRIDIPDDQWTKIEAAITASKGPAPETIAVEAAEAVWSYLASLGMTDGVTDLYVMETKAAISSAIGAALVVESIAAQTTEIIWKDLDDRDISTDVEPGSALCADIKAGITTRIEDAFARFKPGAPVPSTKPSYVAASFREKLVCSLMNRFALTRWHAEAQASAMIDKDLVGSFHPVATERDGDVPESVVEMAIRKYREAHRDYGAGSPEVSKARGDLYDLEELCRRVTAEQAKAEDAPALIDEDEEQYVVRMSNGKTIHTATRPDSYERTLTYLSRGGNAPPYQDHLCKVRYEEVPIPATESKLS